jgi:NAD(P)-dependent dehydrogenase (short-subunit alcohol dehydrogenase family)
VVAVGLIAETTDEQYDAVMDANAKGRLVAIREAARRLRDNSAALRVRKAESPDSQKATL